MTVTSGAPLFTVKVAEEEKQSRPAAVVGTTVAEGNLGTSRSGRESWVRIAAPGDSSLMQSRGDEPGSETVGRGEEWTSLQYKQMEKLKDKIGKP